MFKELKKYQVQMTPFQAAKTWNLNNIDNDDLLLFESTGSDDGEPIDLEYVDYSGAGPSNNYNCQIALEQQTDDMAIYQEGLRLTGPFYPELEPQNPNGTYKRVVHAQIKTTFYNDYRDPTKLLGLENIDFENSRNKRRLADRLRMFDIPTTVFGDKIVPNTLKIYDTTLDNDYTIVDDGYGNLFAQRNLFSNQQAIGEFANTFDSGSSSSVCDVFFWPNATPVLSGSLTVSSVFFIGTGSLFWSAEDVDGATLTLYRSTTATYPSFSVIATPTGFTTYDDVGITIADEYIYKLEIVNASSSFTNEFNLSFGGTIDDMESYTVGDTASFAGGYGWRTGWRTISTIGLISLDDMESYTTGATGSFGGGYGWLDFWTGSSYISLTDYDTMDSYSDGQTGSFDGGAGWATIWRIV